MRYVVEVSIIAVGGLAGCHAGERAGATAPTGPTAQSKAQPPAGVPAGYAAAAARLRSAGDELLMACMHGESDAVYARFSPAFQAAVPRADIAKVCSVDPSVKLSQEHVWPDEGHGMYAVRADSTTGPLAVILVFNASGLIDGMKYDPWTEPADKYAGRITHARLRLPVDGTWWVFWGGDDQLANYHVIAPDQRHASDLVIWRDGASHSGSGARVTDYYAWDQPIVAPADGRVAFAVDDRPDNTPGTETDRAHPAGNHVMLDLGDGEFMLLAHMHHGSVAVHTGDAVKRGQLLGHVGNSGNTSEPHLHVHLQDQAPLFGNAVGLPLEWTDLVVDGATLARPSFVQGTFVANGS